MIEVCLFQVFERIEENIARFINFSWSGISFFLYECSSSLLSRDQTLARDMRWFNDWLINTNEESLGRIILSFAAISRLLWRRMVWRHCKINTFLLTFMFTRLYNRDIKRLTTIKMLYKTHIRVLQSLSKVNIDAAK